MFALDFLNKYVFQKWCIALWVIYDVIQTKTTWIPLYFSISHDYLYGNIKIVEELGT